MRSSSSANIGSRENLKPRTKRVWERLLVSRAEWLIAKGLGIHGVDALMHGFSWSKASWEIAQCAEKIMKTVLVRAGCKRMPERRDGHDIPSLGHLLEREGGVSLDFDDLGLIHCDPKVRHGEQVANAEAAHEAHRTWLRLLKTLSDQLGMSEYAQAVWDRYKSRMLELRFAYFACFV